MVVLQASGANEFTVKFVAHLVLYRLFAFATYGKPFKFPCLRSVVCLPKVDAIHQAHISHPASHPKNKSAPREKVAHKNGAAIPVSIPAADIRKAISEAKAMPSQIAIRVSFFKLLHFFHIVVTPYFSVIFDFKSSSADFAILSIRFFRSSSVRIGE
jgi:hypothetical protein